MFAGSMAIALDSRGQIDACGRCAVSRWRRILRHSLAPGVRAAIARSGIGARQPSAGNPATANTGSRPQRYSRPEGPATPYGQPRAILGARKS